MFKILFAIGFYTCLLVPAAAQGERLSAAGTNEEGTAASAGLIVAALPENARKRPNRGDNFYEYANWDWLKTAQIAPDALSAGAIRDVSDRTRRAVADLEKDLLATDWPEYSDEAKYQTIYRAFLDEPRANRRNLRPISPFLRAIRRARSYNGLATVMGSYRIDIGGVFQTSLRISQSGAQNYVAHLDAAPLLLGRSDIYLQDDPRTVQLRQTGVELLASLLGRTGSRSNLDQRIAAILALETRLARLLPPPAAERDPHRVRQWLTGEALADAAPDFPWALYFKARGLPNDARLDIAPFEDIAAIGKLFRATPKKVWRDYLTLRLIKRYGAFLSEDIAINVAQIEQIETGIRRPVRSRPARASRFAQRIMPDIMARKYAQAYLAPETLDRVTEMAEALRAAYRRRIARAPWLGEETRTQALAKLDQLRFMIGTPPDWNDYSRFVPDQRDLFANAYSHLQFRHLTSLTRLREPSDNPRDLDALRSHIFFSPLQVGAYYLPRLNTVIVPAAYLQPPFFDPDGNKAANYGALGTTLGHEIGHAFDDHGSKFGPGGALENWWSDADRRRFDRLGAALAAQYEGLEAAPGVPLDTALTLGENLSDLAGLQTALSAYRAANPQATDKELQTFFIAYANKRRKIRRPETDARLALTDRHSPPHLRTNIILSNIDEWYKAFALDETAALWRPPEARVKIW